MHRTLLSQVLSTAVLLMTLALARTVQAHDITGAGSSFAYPVYTKWAEAYKGKTGVGFNYKAIGSGSGIKAIKQRAVTFGASDMPLKPEELRDAGLIQFPALIAAAVPVVNIPGVPAGALILDGPTLASIYLGEVTRWNDPRISRLNPALKLPATVITPIYRADATGTNLLFTAYLSAVSPVFRGKVGTNTAVEWPKGIGSKGGEGVANMMAQTDGAIGYVEYATARLNNQRYVRLINRAGKVVGPSVSSIQAAAANADWGGVTDSAAILTDLPGADSWPIVRASFILVEAAPHDPAATGEVIKFFNWAFDNGAPAAMAIDYIPLPAKLISSVRARWGSAHAGELTASRTESPPARTALAQRPAVTAAGSRPSADADTWVPAKRIALVIGNSNYNHPGTAAGEIIWPDLEGGPQRNADAVAARLRQLHFEVIEARDADQDQMNASLRQLAARIAAAPDGLALFFYSGHGAQGPRALGEDGDDSYLIPVRTNLVTDVDADAKGISLTKVRNILHHSRAGVIILDACRNNALRHMASRAMQTRGLASPENVTGMLIAYSTPAGEVASNRARQMSQYTELLVGQLGAPGQSLTSMFRSVRKRMSELGAGRLPALDDQLNDDIVLVP